jgi:hypothetical protein
MTKTEDNIRLDYIRTKIGEKTIDVIYSWIKEKKETKMNIHKMRRKSA